MTRTFSHQLNKEVQSISGWYTLYKEERIAPRDIEYLYLVGDWVVESSCCGVGGCRYAVVPGSIVNWKSGTNGEGFFTSVVEPIKDEKVQGELREIISKKEQVSQVQFW
jgi:hypothetical protein